MPDTPRLLGLATALPPHRLDQAESLAAARALYGPWLRDFERLAPVFANSGIATRHTCRPLDWYLQPHGWADRAAAFEQGALALLRDAAERALERAGLPARAVDAVVCVTTTGIATPSLDALLMEPLGLRPDILRLPVFGLGCAGGVLGLGRAAQLARAMPGATVLLLVVELCTLACRTVSPTPADVVASALFADGAAAAVVGGGPAAVTAAAAPALGLQGEHTWPGTRRVMGWRVEDEGLGVVFAQDIPALIRTRLRPVVEGFLERSGMGVGDLAGLVCHPGGAKVLDALREAFDPLQAGLDDAWAVLRACGNMSAPSVLFVLERRIAAGLRGTHLLTALGPGFTAGMMLVEG